MPRYTYKCEPCNFEYVEIRDTDQPQIFTHHGCGEQYLEVAE